MPSVLTLRMIILTSFSTVELESHGNVVDPGTRVQTDEPGSEMRVKTVFFDRVMIVVPSEYLNKGKLGLLICVSIVLDLGTFYVFNSQKSL